MIELAVIVAVIWAIAILFFLAVCRAAAIGDRAMVGGEDYERELDRFPSGHRVRGCRGRGRRYRAYEWRYR